MVGWPILDDCREALREGGVTSSIVVYYTTNYYETREGGVS